ncbi:MAG: DUF4909 domain-containing protein [Bacteroidetes bacterium]|nr:DUF4909 domain-containing protein [Bacteroidota bacterium]
MRKDIEFPEVENVALAVVKEQNELAQDEWNVYFVNLKNEPLEGVLVTSSGYGQIDGEEIKTSTLRHFLDTIEPKSFSKIEPIMENVFGLNNEYWISFYHNKKMYDKKYIFLAETIKEEYFTTVPILNKRGVMIK